MRRFELEIFLLSSEGELSQFRVHEDGTARFANRICVPDELDLKRDILEEAHYSSYTIHPGGTKIYRGLKEHYWWNDMKREIATFVAHCLPLTEFAYNNSYQASIQMVPYEAFYGRKCRSHVCFDDVGEKKLLGPEMLQITEQKVKQSRE
ncbi:uncharacterized protein LOC120251368 [Dioscorea cayenensis subsp. rotundata]|uniref:Uncharacterized protein LOC120251368 n=1 Tax=Dioscorea cayennensis subsp. rotundata TaxID=55577 RepID=A0AB40ALL5_DIOCR|nr:uncharacterized protein LOC120251368 [Dioscorea cayenensis subsp. rotundata]